MLEYNPATMMKNPARTMQPQNTVFTFCHLVPQYSERGVRWNQKRPEMPYVNQLAKSALMTPRRSLKNGMTSAMMNARIQIATQMPIHVAQPVTVCEVRWFECWPLRRNLRKHR